MTLILVLIFFKSICLYLQNIVLGFYEKFLNPKQKYYTQPGRSIATTFSSIWHSNWQNKVRQQEREQLIDRIRARRRAKIQRSCNQKEKIL